MKKVGEDNMYDFAETVHCNAIRDLLDGKGYVELLDFHPRIVPKGYTPEAGIIQAARTSYAQGLKDPIADKLLLEYLFYNKHTSPLEFANVTFAIKIPQVMGVHLLRHRTGKFNVFSARYSYVDEDMGFYNPLKNPHGIRYQSQTNKQGSSNSPDQEHDSEIIDLMSKANEYQEELHKIYTLLVKKHKIAKEIARFWLPQSQYQIMHVQFDLNNLIKMLFLRNDSHAQQEIQDYAKAMEQLCTPLFPTIFAAYQNVKHGLMLAEDELNAFVSEIPLQCDSKSRKLSYEHNVKRLKKNM